MVVGSPAWKPHATLALVTIPSSAASSPSRQTPKPSPRAAVRSTVPPPDVVTGAVSHRNPARRTGATAGMAPAEPLTLFDPEPPPTPAPPNRLLQVRRIYAE